MKKLFLILLLSLAYSAHAQTTTITTQTDNNTSACATSNSPVVGSQSCTSNTLQMTDNCSIPNSGNCNTGANTVIFNEAPANIADFTNDGMNPHTVPYSGFNGKMFGHWIPFFDCPGNAGDCIYAPKLPNPPGANTFSNHVVTGYSSHGANQVIAELKQFCRMGLDGFIDDWSGMQFSAASTTRKNEDAALQLMVAGLSSQSCAANMKFSLMLDQTIFHTSATCGTSSQTPSCAEKAWEDSLDWANLSTTFTSRIDGGTYTGKGYALNSHYLWMNCTSLGCSFTPEGTGHPVFGTFVSESDHFSTCSGCAVWNDGVAGVTCTGSSDCWNKVWVGIAHHVATYAHKPYFIFRNNFTNHAAQNDGSYRWVNPTTTQSNWDQSGYDTWLTTAAAGPTCNGHKCVAFGAAYKGIDHAQSGFQSDNLIVDQRCGKTWLDTLKEPATRGFSTSNQLQAIQINTISDYDEGSEIQTGIDSCYSLAATMGGDGHTLSYTMTTSDSSAAPLLPLNATVNHFAIFYSSDGVNVTKIIPPVGMASAGSIDLNSLSIPAGSYTVYLKMVGQFSIKNKIVGPYSYTSSSGGGGGSSGTGATNRIDINTQTVFHAATDTGAANAYVVAIHSAPAYSSGMPVVFIPAHNNTTTSTINVNGLGVKTIKKQTSIGLADVAASDIQTSIITFLVYDGTYFELIGPFGNATASGGAFSGVNAQTISYLALSGDNGKLVSMNGTSITLTLPAAPPSSTWAILVENVNATDLTISRNSLNIDGAASNLTLHQHQGVIVFTDGTNYFTSRGKPTLTASDIPNITESQVTSLVSDLALKAPLASPALTGTPTAPTATAGTNTTQLATTAFVTTAVAGGGGSGTVTSVATSSPLTGGTITTTGTIGIQDAAADGSTKGASTFTAADFNASSGVISLDYTNGQAASGSNKGFLTSTDWSTFNNKVAGPVSATDSDFAQFDGTTGKLIKDGGLALDTNTSLTANSDSKIPSQKAVKAYVDSFAPGGGSSLTLKTNSTNNASQTVLNTVDGNGITVTDNGSGSIQFKQTPLTFWTPGVGTGGTVSVVTANVVRLAHFVLTNTVAFNKIGVQNGTADASNKYSFGVFSLDGTVRYAHTTEQVMSGSNTFRALSIVESTVTLAPGDYLFAWTGAATTATFLTLSQTGGTKLQPSSSTTTTSLGVMPAATINVPTLSTQSFANSVPAFILYQ